MSLHLLVGLSSGSQKTSLSPLPSAVTQLKKSSLSENYATKLSQKEKEVIVKLISTATTTLDISNNSISDEGAKAIAEDLKTNQTLTTLYIDGNNISSVGAKAIADALKTNQTLRILYIGGNNISGEGAIAKAIAEALRNNKTQSTEVFGPMGPSGHKRTNCPRMIIITPSKPLCSAISVSMTNKPGIRMLPVAGVHEI
ncbi:unnamed protein product [Didymodactylos carnosus]|uniref:Uncharacterized protein n=1 Tax=Didymodactylos carnosus TaxID=1234261 RepID=A0A813VP04_9BILA|nr:unnamed protein product [Didymodactylos carnosus]CAF3633698.1 unnamed protein product [Didymodactylos carnosus]